VNENLARLKRAICGYRDVELVLAVRNRQITSSEIKSDFLQARAKTLSRTSRGGKESKKIII
jgi:hypothetical protein